MDNLVSVDFYKKIDAVQYYVEGTVFVDVNEEDSDINTLEVYVVPHQESTDEYSNGLPICEITDHLRDFIKEQITEDLYKKAYAKAVNDDWNT